MAKVNFAISIRMCNKNRIVHWQKSNLRHLWY